MKNNKITCSICLKEKPKQLFCLDGSEQCLLCYRRTNICLPEKPIKNKKQNVDDCIKKEKIQDLSDNELINISIDMEIEQSMPVHIEQKHKNNDDKKIISKKKRKKGYPKVFSDKRRILLDDARKHNGCTACGSKELLQVHHIDVDIFNNDDSNLLVLCYYCHAKEHKHMQGKKPAKFLK